MANEMFRCDSSWFILSNYKTVAHFHIGSAVWMMPLMKVDSCTYLSLYMYNCMLYLLHTHRYIFIWFIP